MCCLRILAVALWCTGIAFRAEAQTGPDARGQYLDPGGVDLGELVRLAMDRNGELNAARQRLLEAQGLLRQAGFRPNPVFETEFTGGGLTGSPGERGVSLVYAHTFELGDKRSRRIDVANRDVEIARLDVLDRERQLRAAVQEQYIIALSAIRNFEAVAQQREVTQQGYIVIRQRVEAGESPRVEEMVLRADVGRLEAERLLLEGEVQQALLTLRVVAGFEMSGALRLRPDGDRVPVTMTRDEAIALGLSSRPDLAALRADEQRAQAEVALVRAERTPDLAALFRFTDARTQFDQRGFDSFGALTQIRDHDRTLTGGISISLPFMHRNQGAVQASMARQTAATLRREYQERFVRVEIAGAYTRYVAARRATEVFEQAVIGPSQESVTILRASYAAGEVQLFDVVAEQRRLIETQKAYTETTRQEALARVSLERAVGSLLK